MEDVERLFSPGVISFMDRKEYEFEAQCLRVVQNWRHLIDERGLSDEERHKYSMEFLDSHALA